MQTEAKRPHSVAMWFEQTAADELEKLKRSSYVHTRVSSCVTSVKCAETSAAPRA